jgi:hypothetical protein
MLSEDLVGSIPATSTPARSIPFRSPSSVSGIVLGRLCSDKIGHYDVISLLGKGGMGEDTKPARPR